MTRAAAAGAGADVTGHGLLSSLLMPSGPPIIERVAGDAVTVLHAVLTDWPT
ncbi:MAG: hypothetical protein M3Y48_23000 [Actinomycetota bacterium]|nr:hypothetical protein [Actinomycetota bacterium]